MKLKIVFLSFASGTRPASARKIIFHNRKSSTANPASLPRAFSLIELLIVIAIIGILAAMILPALARSKESVRAAACVNNMHQLAVASMVYTADTGRFPSVLEWLYPFQTTGAPGPVGGPGSGNPLAPQNDLGKGQLYPYLQSKDVYRCPSETGTISPFGPIDHSYQMSCMMCHAHDITRTLAPSRTVYFVEVTNQTRGFSTGMTGTINVSSPASTQMAFRHNRHEHFVFVDMHAERLNQKQYLAESTDKRFWYPTDDTSRLGNP